MLKVWGGEEESCSSAVSLEQEEGKSDGKGLAKRAREEGVNIVVVYNVCVGGPITNVCVGSQIMNCSIHHFVYH